jgi:hypothetical protein
MHLDRSADNIEWYKVANVTPCVTANLITVIKGLIMHQIP